jgi:hypothetical protein
MGNECTCNLKIKPKTSISEQLYRNNRLIKVKFAEKNIYHSFEHYPDAALSSAEKLEKRAKEILISKIMEHEMLDHEFVQRVTREILQAKQAMDECIYEDLVENNESYSIVPYSRTDM